MLFQVLFGYLWSSVRHLLCLRVSPLFHLLEWATIATDLFGALCDCFLHNPLYSFQENRQLLSGDFCYRIYQLIAIFCFWGWVNFSPSKWSDLYVLKLFFTVERALAKWVDRRSSNSSGPCSVLGKWSRGDRRSLASICGWHADGCHRSPALHHSSTWGMVPRPVRHLGTLTPTLAHLHFRLHCDWYSCYIRHG